MQPKLDANTEDIKQLKLDLEVPKLVTAPENCGEAVKIGVKESRSIILDPDGSSVKGAEYLFVFSPLVLSKKEKNMLSLS